MEECEALCDTVGIMVAGRQRCFGSPQHLKNRWSQGYALQVKLQDIAAVEAVQEAVRTQFYGAQLKVPSVVELCKIALQESHERTLMFQLPPSTETTWSGLFAQVERLTNDKSLHIEDYSLTQSSLEQVFLAFAALRQGGV